MEERPTRRGDGRAGTRTGTRRGEPRAFGLAGRDRVARRQTAGPATRLRRRPADGPGAAYYAFAGGEDGVVAYPGMTPLGGDILTVARTKTGELVGRAQIKIGDDGAAFAVAPGGRCAGVLGSAPFGADPVVWNDPLAPGADAIGMVTPVGGNVTGATFAVAGNHVYGRAGTYAVSVVVADRRSSSPSPCPGRTGPGRSP